MEDKIIIEVTITKRINGNELKYKKSIDYQPYEYETIINQNKYLNDVNNLFEKELEKYNNNYWKQQFNENK